jgi:ubiquinone/menaquinone biosynthesis C-methylase UbiE
MSDQHTAFIGSIPENYDRYLGPALFEPYAADMVERLNVPESASVLEMACGTGIVTRRLRDRLPPGVRLVATDLNEAMMAYAARKFRSDEAVEWKQADATDLPFPDESFDTVVCQFGLMFVPDKERAIHEAYRVLQPGGTFLFSVWDAIEQNDLAHIAHTTISTFFEQDPPNFYEVPFSFHDPEAIESLLVAAGFREIQLSPLTLPSISPSASDAAKGLIEGNPVIVAINERRPSSVPKIVAAVAAAVAARCGDRPVQGRMQAFVCTALR